jgi:hypothetical protein
MVPSTLGLGTTGLGRRRRTRKIHTHATPHLFTSSHRNVKIFIGGPGASGAAGSGYIPSDDLVALINQTRHNFPASFGGASFWDASQAYNNGGNAISNYVHATGQALSGQGARCGGSYVLKGCSSSATVWNSNTAYQGGNLVSLY